MTRGAARHVQQHLIVRLCSLGHVVVGLISMIDSEQLTACLHYDAGLTVGIGAGLLLF